MTPLERTRKFLGNEPVDRAPCHPIIMRWAARYAGVNYRSFCLDYLTKCAAMLRCAEDFDLDWVTVMSDPWVEAEAFGVHVEYPEDDLPKDVGGHLQDLGSVRDLEVYEVGEHRRLQNRVREIEEFRRLAGNRYFVVGWVEGPMAEYADLRGAANAALDLYDDPEAVKYAMGVIVDGAEAFITAQVEAGADCVGIGDAFASQIGPRLYERFVFDGERRLVEHIHSLGAVAKLHICGDTTPILPKMIETGADIVDVDHLVTSLAPFTGLLGEHQVFCGKCDPVSVVQDGTADVIEAAVQEDYEAAGGRCIVSAGCEIPPDTSLDNVRALRRAADRVGLRTG